MDIKTISVLGCGWFGLPFAKKLVENGYHVKGSTTTAIKLEELKSLNIKPYLIDLNEEGEFINDFFETDVLFIAVPPKAKENNSKLYYTKMQRIVKAAEQKAKHVVFISSTGVFEDGNFEVDESHVPNPITQSGKVLKAVETMFMQNINFTTTIIRFAGLIGPNRNLAKFFAGKENVPNGNAPINLITLDDCIGFCLQLINTQKFGDVYHAVTPHHPSRKEFYTRLCEISGMKKPAFNNELLAWKQVDSVNNPQKLGYRYFVKNWFDWLNTNPVL